MEYTIFGDILLYKAKQKKCMASLVFGNLMSVKILNLAFEKNIVIFVGKIQIKVF